MAFRKLGIKEEIIRVIIEENFEKPFEIQEKAIPFILEGKDVIAQAATGSGKTLAFGVGIIHSCKHEEKIQTLVLVPTRELAEQVADHLKKFSKYNYLKVLKIYGGVGIEPQISSLKEADVVVGTPGRILDHIHRGTIDLRWIKILVLDEADRMFDMGFIRDVEKIIRSCPEKRQTLMFSATISQDITHLARKYMKNPIDVSAESYVDPSKLNQIYYDVQESDKISLFIHLLKNEESELIMVFCATRRRADVIARQLQSQGVNAIAIHGGISQNNRNRIMQDFHTQKISVLVCTDVAARGLDIRGVSHIYNFDIPNDSKEYIHRVGRTARAGEKGKAISFVSRRDYPYFQSVFGNKELTIKREELPEFERLAIYTKRYESGRARFGRTNFSRGHSGQQRSQYHERSEGYHGGRDNEGRGNKGYHGGSHNRGRRNIRRFNRNTRRKNFRARRNFNFF